MLATHLASNIQYADTESLFQFAREVQIMLEERKTEIWFYLDALGHLLENCCQWGPHDHRKVTFLQQLQHLGTQILLLAILERESDPWLSMQRNCQCTKGTTTGPNILAGCGKVQIVLHLLLCVAEQGVSAEFDESVHISLLSFFERLAGWATNVPPQLPWDTIRYEMISRLAFVSLLPTAK